MQNKKKAYLALLIVCIFWGTTYLAIKIGVATIPPFLFSGIRQLTAGIILLIILPLFKMKYSFNWQDIGKQAIPAILMIVCGNALLGWAEQYIPSGLTALIASAIPLYVAMINFAVPQVKRVFSWKIVVGLLLGSIGIILVFRDNLSDIAQPDYFNGILVTLGASFCWSLGTVYMKRSSFQTNSFVNAAFQFTIAGLILMIVSLITEDYSHIEEVTTKSLWSLIYMIFFGSIIPYMCYLYAIEHLKVGIVSVYAYVNPFIALLLGAAILQERLTYTTGFAFIATAGGIYCINSGNKVIIKV
ncbi:MAG: EamA family transporter [Flavobacterium sp.]|uniref:DMT family transporter n=1 Tax=Flavobacterium sp. TaxID=239 RepID=UPI0032650F53